jgi:hypothetical protein
MTKCLLLALCQVALATAGAASTIDAAAKRINRLM